MIYFLEDDESIRDFVLYALNNSGMEAEGFELPSELYGALQKRVPDLLLLDIMLPEEDGLSVLKKLRNRADTSRLPVIMLTARSTEYDKVNGLDAGADDYLTKPFGAMELIARINALLRRVRRDSDDIINLRGLMIDTQSRVVSYNGKTVALTNKEYCLLLILVKNIGRVFTRDELLRQVWGFDFSGESRTVDVHIRTLRSKLGLGGELIETIRGVGYIIYDK